ncbi:hypothetical protein DAPPUDRAFT_249830 [Daphnia pulex]|uniref:Uncharacterized protein n=1 Tax=Daphnia pulex TaxID=6669 RepID=E9GXD0_DAPPU|nr:hypothetical protein DAPPUDRAFT_249830 [Daphnia pulex]|eukprot:EFX75848.1 hypothetical protein DAPPUDRAFT_249830 [Daphnia pulex]
MTLTPGSGIIFRSGEAWNDKGQKKEFRHQFEMWSTQCLWAYISVQPNLKLFDWLEESGNLVAYSYEFAATDVISNDNHVFKCASSWAAVEFKSVSAPFGSMWADNRPSHHPSSAFSKSYGDPHLDGDGGPASQPSGRARDGVGARDN